MSRICGVGADERVSGCCRNGVLIYIMLTAHGPLSQKRLISSTAHGHSYFLKAQTTVLLALIVEHLYCTLPALVDVWPWVLHFAPLVSCHRLNIV